MTNVSIILVIYRHLQKCINIILSLSTVGPFYIACDDDTLYLTVNKEKNYEVEATYDIYKAKKFFIVRCSKGDNHFRIIYETPVSLTSGDESCAKLILLLDGDPENRPPIPRYLCANVNWRGRSKRGKPIRMSSNGQSISCQLVIHSRTNSFRQPADLGEWVNGKEAFFVNCQERTLSTPVSSYLCAYMSGSIECKPTVKSHENNKFMLFRLLKSAKEASAHSTPATSDEGDEKKV